VPPLFSETPPSGPPTQAFGTRTVGRPPAQASEPEVRRRRLLPWIAGAVVVVALLAGGAALLLGGGGDDPSADGTSSTTEGGGGSSGGDLSAEDTVEAYFSALGDQDCPALIGYVAEATWSEGGNVEREDALATCEEDQADATRYQLERSELREGGGEEDETALVDVTVSAEGESTSVAVSLVREDGGWRIDFTGV
jgi:hypothetical protein